MSQITFIAKNEFSRLVQQPVVLLVICILCVLSVINVLAVAKYLHNYESAHDPFMMPGLGNVFFYNSIFLSAVSTFIGVIAIAGDRSNGNLGILLTKPLYRRDVLAGKYLGILTFILAIAAMCVIFSVAGLLIFYGGPRSSYDASIRILTYILMLFLNSALTAAITMAVAVVVKNVLGTLICVGSLFFFEWQVSIHGSIQNLIGDMMYLNQRILYFTAIGSGNLDLFNTSSPYISWLEYAIPYILTMVVALLVFMSLSFFTFCREDE